MAMSCYGQKQGRDSKLMVFPLKLWLLVIAASGFKSQSRFVGWFAQLNLFVLVLCCEFSWLSSMKFSYTYLSHLIPWFSSMIRPGLVSREQLTLRLASSWNPKHGYESSKDGEIVYHLEFLFWMEFEGDVVPANFMFRCVEHGSNWLYIFVMHQPDNKRVSIYHQGYICIYIICSIVTSAVSSKGGWFGGKVSEEQRQVRWDHGCVWKCRNWPKTCLYW